MLRRSNTKSSLGLSRSRSVASVRSAATRTTEHIGSADGIRDAHVAATLSFARARERNRTGFSSSVSYSHLHHTASSENEGAPAGCPKAGLHHRRSVRFINSHLEPHSSTDSQSSVTGNDTKNMPLSTLSNSENRYLGKTSSLYDVPGAHNRNDAYLHSLQTTEDHYTSEDDIVPDESSYPKLRKSKSMFTPPVHTGTRAFTDYPGFRAYTMRPSNAMGKENQRPSHTSHHLRAPKSMSFLSYGGDRQPRRASRQENDLAINMARDMFQENVQQQQQRLKSRPSRVFRSWNKRSDTTVETELRKAFRSSSNASSNIPLSFTTSNLSVSKGRLRDKTRKVSSNLKSKLKKFLNRTKREFETIPTFNNASDAYPFSTASEAREVHETKLVGNCFQASESQNKDICPTTDKVACRKPSLHDVPPSQQLKSCQGSMESLQSAYRQPDDCSRATSWSSSRLGTEASSASIPEWENRRLSVIRERGTNPSTPCLQTCPSPRQVLQQNSHGQDAVSGMASQSSGSRMKGERVYSALMKREREKNSSAESGSNDQTMAAHLADGGLGARGSGCPSSQTIRCVQRDDDVFVDEMETTPQHGADDFLADGSGNSSCGSVVRKRLPALYASGTASDRGSVFPTSPDSFLFRAGSAYRRTLNEAMSGFNETQSPGYSEPYYMPSMSNLDLPLRCPSPPVLDADGLPDYTSSVYSSGASIAGSGRSAADQTPTKARARRPSYGEAKIFIDTPTPLPVRSTDPGISNADSGEWKLWLSSKVSKFKNSTPDRVSASPLGDMITRPRRSSPGHVREGAEVESPDANVSDTHDTPVMLPPLRVMSQAPSAAVSTQALTTPAVLAERFLIREQNENTPPTPANQDYAGDAVKEPVERPPPIPAKSSLRPAPSLPCIRTPTISGPSKLPRSSPRKNSSKVVASPCPDLRRRPGIRLARRSRLGLRTSGTVTNFQQASPADDDGTMGKDKHLRASASSGNLLNSGRWANGEAAATPTRAMGSKEMVDQFLSSRRRKIVGSENDDVFL